MICMYVSLYNNIDALCRCAREKGSLALNCLRYMYLSVILCAIFEFSLNDRISLILHHIARIVIFEWATVGVVRCVSNISHVKVHLRAFLNLCTRCYVSVIAHNTHQFTLLLQSGI